MVKKRKNWKAKQDYDEQYVETDLSKQMKEDALAYGIYVIKHRALPDIRDGLLPVHRRIIYTLYHEGVTSNKPYYKNARTEGLVMRLSPHGSAYLSIAHLGAEWKTPIPIIDFHGNVGSIRGDSPAASRYTEGRLSKYGDMFVSELSEDIVPFKDNYSQDFREPTVLPIEYPALLANHSAGIAVGMSADILPHNPREVLKATLKYLKNENITLDELLKEMPGPDFITGGIILNSKESKEYYENGSFNFKVRGRVKKEKNKIIITEVPFSSVSQVNNLSAKIAELVIDKKIKNARDVKNFSNVDGINIEVLLKSGCNIDDLEKELYAKTKLEDTVRGHFLVIKDGGPKVVGLIEYLESWTEFQHTILKNKYKSKLNKANNRLEIVDGLILAYPNIDVIIDIIKNAKKQTDIIKALTTGDISKIPLKTKKNQTIAKKFNFSDAQAENILNTRLRRLTTLDDSLLVKEKKELEKNIKHYTSFINSRSKRQKEIIKKQEDNLNNNEIFSEEKWKRKTTLSNLGTTVIIEDNKPIDTVISIDKFGSIKSIDQNTEVDNQIYKNTLKSDDSIGLFSQLGNFYKFKVKDIKQTKPNESGISLASWAMLSISEQLLDINEESVIVFSDSNKEIIQVTSSGLARKIDSDNLITNRKKISSIKLKDNQLIFSEKDNNKKYLVLVTSENKVKKLDINSIKKSGRSAEGNVTGKLKDGDYITKAYQVDDNDVLSINDKEVKVSSLSLEKTTTTFKAFK